MKHRPFWNMAAALLIVFAADAGARTNVQPPKIEPAHGPSLSHDGDAASLQRARTRAAVDTTFLGYWDFDGLAGACDAQGWTSADRTAQTGTYFHVDDFAGMPSPYAPLVGAQSMWCGVRAGSGDPVICDYSAAPGYGNLWSQYFRTTSCLNVTGDVVIDYVAKWDSEPGYDRTLVQYDLCDENWQNVTGFVFDYEGQGTFSDVLDSTNHSGDVRLRFWFASDGAFSDQDGLFPTDGAFFLDSLTVSDAGGNVLPTETFETESVGDQMTTSGNWEAAVPESYGDYAALFNGGDVLQEDGCYTNATCVWGFFSGSTVDYGCGGHPEQTAVPFGTGTGLFMRNEIWSPVVALAGARENVVLQFDVYGDTPLDNLVFFVWAVREINAGCPDGWFGGNTFYWNAAEAWDHRSFTINQHLHTGAPEIQVALGVYDACNWYCGSLGSGSCHSHGPLFDNVSLCEVDYTGPEMYAYASNLFSDAFPEDGTTTGTVRADAGYRTTGFGPENYAVIEVKDYVDGLAYDPMFGGEAVYGYVTVKPDQPGKRGAILTNEPAFYPLVDSLSIDGTMWYKIRTNRGQGDTYRFGLRDGLFTPGDTVCYFFCAQADTPSSYVNYWSEFTGTTNDINAVASNAIEFTCLPTGAGDILYVDNVDGLGAQPFYDTAFEMMGLAGQVDRYDARGASSETVVSSIHTRLPNPAVQLSGYRKIIWETGNESLKPFVTTSFHPNFNDFQLLHTFLANLDTTGGVYVAGNDAAEFWGENNADTWASMLRNDYMSHAVIFGSHLDAGFGVSPLVIGAPGQCLDHGGDVDSLLVFGGCSMPPAHAPIVEFDVLSPSGSAVTEASYASGTPQAAIVSQRTTNPGGHEVGFILSGFSFAAIRDAEPTGVPARAEHLYDILIWLDNQPGQPTPAGNTPRTYLAQNYPNPFNPSTTIRFALSGREHVRVNVYNVAGQLVATLVDREMAPGVEYTVEWDGRNASGTRVASGVYFYRMTTDEFSQTRKMVLLK